MKEERHFRSGDEIKISNDYHWAKKATGKIAQLPVEFEGEKWTENYYKNVESLKGIMRVYWIKFDLPHFDADGDGPYSEAEIEEKYLELVI